MTSRWGRIGAGVAACLTAFAGALDPGAAAQHAPGKPPVREAPARLSVILAVDPAHATAACPHTIGFMGRVVIGEGSHPDNRIAYQWLRSDNARVPVRYMPVRWYEAPLISQTWTLGSKKGGEASGWQQLKIWWPSQPDMVATSDRASFDLTCR